MRVCVRACVRACVRVRGNHQAICSVFCSRYREKSLTGKGGGVKEEEEDTKQNKRKEE